MSRAVRILRYGVTEAGKLYNAGEVVEQPSPALIRMATEEEAYNGERLAEFVEQKVTMEQPRKEVVVLDNSGQIEPEPEEQEVDTEPKKGRPRRR